MRTLRFVALAAALAIFGAPEAWATLPTPNQPILVVQDSTSADPYQNFVPELLTTEGLNGFQSAQLPDLSAASPATAAAFLASYDVIILPHLTLTSAQATLFSNYVNAGGTLVGFRPSLQLANVFGVASLGTTLSEGWLKIDTSTAFGSGLDSHVMKFHGAADMYSLNGASALATLYSNSTTPTASPAAAIYSFGSGKAILFSFDLTQSNVLMRQGNPAWAGYPNNHDGYNTLRAGQMFMDQGTGQFWNDLGDGALNDVPQADIQLRLFSNALVLINAAKRPLPRFWYFPNQNRALLLFTGDEHAYDDDLQPSIDEISAVQSFGGKFSEFLWYPFGLVSNSQVNTWVAAGHALGVHFDDTAEMDGSGAGGSAASWSGMQSVITNALSSFATTYPSAPTPITTRDHFLIWLSRNAAGNPDQTAQAMLFQAAGIQLDTSYIAFPNRWGYMGGSGLPMKFLDTTTGSVIAVYEQPTQYEDDVQLGSNAYSTQWNLATAQSHYQQTLSDSLTKYNTVVTMLFHPDSWSSYSSYAQTVLQYAQANAIPMYSTAAWLQFWKGRAATTVSMPAFNSNTLSFTASNVPAGLTLLVPFVSGTNKVVSTLQVDGTSQSFAISTYQGVQYVSVILTAGTHGISVAYATAGRILGQISPSAAVASTTIQVQSGSTSVNVPIAPDGSYAVGLLPAGTYTVTPSSTSYAFSPQSRSVILGTVDINNVNFTATQSGETLFTTQTPALPNANDGVDYELGTAFTASVSGQIAALRFLKVSGESGTHVGSIWSATGTLLASVTFANETASGWQQQALAAPLNIAAATTYIVSVNTANQFYVATSGGLASQVVNGHLSSVVGNNGIFGDPGQFPANSFNNTNYFRDIVFLPGSALASVTLNPSGVVGGSSSIATVTLGDAAPAGGAQVTLSSDNAAATVPSSVTVAAGSTTATFTINTTTVSATTNVNILGSYYGFQTALLAIFPSSLASISLNPSSVTGGNSSTGTAILSAAAPAGGAVVSLSDDSAFATTPASVTIPGGSTSATFTVATSGVASVTMVTVTGTYNVTQTAVLAINPAALSSVSLNPASLVGGNVSTGTVTLNGLAPASGASVTLSSDNAAATVPGSVTVAAGATTATFTVSTSAVGASTPATITGTYNGTHTATLTITTPVLSAVSLSPAAVAGGNTSTGTVMLNGPAPAGGVVVALSSDKPIVSGIEGVYSLAGLPQPGSVDWASFGPEYTEIPSSTVTPVNGISGLNATLSTANGQSMFSMTNCNFGGDCGWYGNFAQGARVLWVSGTYISQTAWWAPNGPLTVQFDSPQRGLGFQMMGDELGQFTATVCAYNAANTLLGCVPFTGNGTATEYNTAAFVGLYDDAQEISKVTIDGGGLLYPHDFAISQMFVTNTRRPIVPVSVAVPAGAVAATFPVSTSAVTTTTTVNITAVYAATQTTPLTINPAVLSTVAMTPSEVLGGSALQGTATLTGAAPAGGLVVSLSANNPVASGVQSVTTATNMPQDGSVSWTDIGPLFTQVPSGTTTPIAGLSSSTVTISTANAQPGYVFINCPDPTDCAWSGNFVPAAPLLWVGGNYVNGTDWVANGPMTLTLSTPQRGLGFNIMADEAGPFMGTVCAYNAGDTLLGCVPFTGNGAPLAGGTNGMAVYAGIYDDAAEISSITIDAGGALYPHDFAINQLFVAHSRRMVPPTVKVQAGAASATFPVNTDAVNTQTTVTVTGNYQGTHAGTLIVDPSTLASLSLSPSAVVGGASVTGTVTFGTPAPGGGAVVTLESDNAAAVVPANVTVLAGATTATFTITTSGLVSATSLTISASSGGKTQTATLTINPPVLSSVALNPSSLVGGSVSTGTVTLNGVAPAAGVVVALSSDNATATVPASVTVMVGAATATFSVSTTAVGSVASATISGTFSGTQSAVLTINPPVVSSVSVSPTSVTGGANSVGTVTLSSAAPAGGASVTLSSDNPAATVPASVTVAAGATTATFTATTIAVGTNTSATISGTYNGAQTATLAINAPILTSLALNPTSLAGGNSSTGTVTLNGTAWAGGATVALSSDNAAATVPVNVTVAAGATTATFTITTSAVGTNTSATISGTYNGTQTAALAINAPVLTSVALNPASLGGGNSSTGTVTLSSGAPAGGAVVALSSNDSTATVPASVTVAGGATTATFTVATVAVTSTTFPTITAIYNGTQTATLTITPAALASVVMSPAAVTGSTSSTGTVTLTGAAPASGITVTLSDNNANATTPASVTVAAGAMTANFTVTTITVNAAATVTITAVYNGVTKTTTLTINPPALASVVMNPSAVLGGTSSTGTVTLNGPAPTGGAVVTLSDNSASSTTPASATVAAGATTANFTVTSVAVGSVTTVTITGTYNGTQTGTLTLNPPTLTSVVVNPTTVTGGTSSTGTVTISSAAPAGGAVVALSDNSASTTTPASVTIAAGGTTANFTVTSVAVGSVTTVTITGTYNGTQTATLTVNPPALTNLTVNPTAVNGGVSATGTVTLGSAAPVGGLPVALSSDNAAATVPATVTVAAGATTANFTVTTTGVVSATAVTITATFNSASKTAALTINPPVLSNLTLNPTAVVGGNNSTGTATLASIAPPGGAVVALSSNNAAATVPATVTVAAGATTATFTVTTSGVSPATSAIITATYNGTKTATLTINPAALSTVVMNPTAVTGGISSTGTVTLTGQAPPLGALVALSSNNLNATTPISVTVAAGATTATFTVTTVPVAAAATATITAVYSGVTKTATLTVNPPALVSVTMNPIAVTGGTSSTGTVTLDSPALTGGAVVTLSDNSASTTTPASVTVAAGATTANFTVTSVSVGVAATVTITATRNGVTKTATLTLNPPQVLSLALNPTTVVGGIANSTATVTLNAPAAGTGAQRTVTLSSSNTVAATVPATVAVTAGATTATFTVTSKSVTAAATSTISATMNGGAQTAVLTVNPITVSSIVMNPAAVTGGTSSIGTVTLNATAPTGGVVVTLADDSASTTTPASVTVAAGATTANFTVTSVAVGSVTTVTITGTRNGTATATLTVNPPVVSNLTLNPATVVGGINSTGTVTLSSAAPVGGAVVTLSSDNVAATAPASVTVAAGATTATFTVTTGTVTASTVANVTGTYNGTKTAALTVTP